MADADIAFVLHTRAYRETSELVDLFCRGSGRFRAVARGARGGRGAPLRPFAPLAVAWRGRGELKTLTTTDYVGIPALWSGEKLYLGMYLNELLIRLLPEDCADEALFDHYRRLMAHLPLTDDTEPLLRVFELALLEAMGYGLDLRFESDHGEPVSPGQWFHFRPGDGLIRLGPGDTVSAERHFSGHQLLGIVESRYDDPMVRRGAKRLLRQALQVHLGDRPLYSRELFITSTAQTKRSHAP